ncbi:MAG: 50S ribosomal protein L11 methyltransferase [Firmicutes bacterium]|nr:50S ribosomal protein L11 methyltransferase [Bacillota bacterium]
MNWIRVELQVPFQNLEVVQGLLVLEGIEQLEIKDNSLNLTDDGVHWDYIENSAIKELEQATIIFFLPDNLDGKSVLKNLKVRFKPFKCTFKTKSVADSAFAVDHKSFFSTIWIGDNLAVVPEWEVGEWQSNYCQSKVGVFINPNMAFGTGEHSTTKMCLELLLEVGLDATNVPPLKDSLFGKTVLDIGSGSGILAIAALKMGAKKAYMYDTDILAVSEANHNAGLNGVLDKCVIKHGEFDLGELTSIGNADIVLANIVTAVLIPLAPIIAKAVSKNVAGGGSIILSGILNTKLDDVKNAYEAQGLRVVKVLQDGDWSAILLSTTD